MTCHLVAYLYSLDGLATQVLWLFYGLAEVDQGLINKTKLGEISYSYGKLVRNYQYLFKGLKENGELIVL